MAAVTFVCVRRRLMINIPQSVFSCWAFLGSGMIFLLSFAVVAMEYVVLGSTRKDTN